ncbi:ketopantoate reductase family protein [Mechercharimyces sp. CAU 1602]|uniref:ketopantoate reductase family protein n=1 Tax=Mechercharimyces sp. CAU 1602 TaxID=2973933 RepID=UPI002161E555|nr:2-dehydropantoate 2-reductase [Mechercharimyces sp. CAU 1602]MCS1350611.1 2-dehydropantoate 2-reductase [Mechercharimyces sp. CAU 1602]
MRTAIWGGGSLGLLWGARVARWNSDVTIVTRTKMQAQALMTAGLTLKHLDGKEETIPIKAFAEDSFKTDEVASRFDCIFVTVKQFHLPEVAANILACAHEETVVLLWQNGLGQDNYFVETPHPHLCAAVTTEGALRRHDNFIWHTGTGHTWIGALAKERRLPSWFLHEVKRWERSAPLSYEENIHLRMWEKVMINSVINPLTTLLDVPNGFLTRLPMNEMMEGILQEAHTVARAEGVDVGELGALKEKVATVYQLTAANTSSMLQDRKAGRRTEIQSINGAIVKIGRQHGIATPIHSLLVHLVEALYDKGDLV